MSGPLKTLAKLVVMIASAVGSYYVFFWMLKNEQVAILLVFSIALHEFGHWIAFHMYGYRSWLVFVPPVGAFVAPEDIEALKKMPRSEDAIVALAGPFMNIVLMVVGFLLSSHPVWGLQAQALVQLNAELAALNLLPVFILDGARFIRALFESTNEEHDRIISGIVSLVALVVAGVLVFLGKFNFYHLIIIFGVQRASRKDDPEEYKSVRSMGLGQAYLALFVYLLMLTFTWGVSLALPRWMSLLQQ